MTIVEKIAAENAEGRFPTVFELAGGGLPPAKYDLMDAYRSGEVRAYRAMDHYGLHLAVRDVRPPAGYSAARWAWAERRR